MFLVLTAFFLHFVCTACKGDFYNNCREGDNEKIKEQLDSGTYSVTSRDAKGNTGLIIAAGRGRSDTVKLLLSQGASHDDATSSGIFEGKTALQWAASQGRADTVSILIQASANPQKPAERGVFAGMNAMMWASSQGRYDVVKLLLSAGVDPDFTSLSGKFKGKTALMWACSQGRVSTVALLLEAGSNVNAVDDDGVSALMWAAGSEAADEEEHKRGMLEKGTKGHVEVIDLLLRYQGMPDMRDKDGITAIMFASFHGHAEAVTALLNAGANADFRNKDRKTALQLARNADHLEAVAAIEEGPTFMKATLEELREMTACGWLVSVLRGPKGTGVYSPSSFTKSEFSIDHNCIVLNRIGLRLSMFDLLYIVHGTHPEKIVTMLELPDFPTRIRANLQLTAIYNRNKEYFTNYFGDFEGSYHWQEIEKMETR